MRCEMKMNNALALEILWSFKENVRNYFYFYKERQKQISHLNGGKTVVII